jgi:hypothetical protein
METLNYLNTWLEIENNPQKCLEHLTEAYAIKVSNNPEYPDLYVLNYDQINSPKTETVTMECRSLVVSCDEDGWYVVSLAFDRFFNYGEGDTTPDVSNLVAYEKVDGSLLTLFNYKGEWLYRTRSMIMPTTSVNGFDITWDDFIEVALDYGQDFDLLDSDVSYILEVVGRENRVVTKYEDKEVYFLAARNNKTGAYISDVLYPAGWNTPNRYKFSSVEDCMQAAKDLPDLQEGYVCYTSDGVPVCKIKSSQYVAAHRIRGEGLNPKRIMQLVMINEQDEYLSVFPEDKEYFEPYLEAWKYLLYKINVHHNNYFDVEDKKEFALLVKDYPYRAVLFKAKNAGISPEESLQSQTEAYKLRLFETTMENQDNG